MFNMENLRNAWDHTFENISLYGEYEDQIRDAVEYIANDEIVRAGRAIEAIHAEDSEDLEDQAREIVEDMVDSIRGYVEDLLGNGFDHDIADSEVAGMMDVNEYFSENQDECESAFFDNQSMSEYGSISDVITAAVYFHISGKVYEELSEVVYEIEQMSDDIMEYMTA